MGTFALLYSVQQKLRAIAKLSRINDDNFFFKCMLHVSSKFILNNKKNERQHEIFNNVVSATSKASDQSAHARSPIRAFATPLYIL